MKKLKKINLELNKEVISSLSGNEMDHVKGGTVITTIPVETGSKCVSCQSAATYTCLTKSCGELSCDFNVDSCIACIKTQKGCNTDASECFLCAETQWVTCK